MKYQKSLILTLLLLSLGLLLGCEQEDPRSQLTSKPEAQLPAFRFSDLEGKPRSSSEWNGQALVINFWATWCPPCRKEMPLLIETQQNYADRGVQFIGIAIDEPKLVQDFVDSYQINFPILIGDTDAIKLAHRLGNRFDSLPFTAVFDRTGKTRFIHVGEMSREALEGALHPLLPPN